MCGETEMTCLGEGGRLPRCVEGRRARHVPVLAVVRESFNMGTLVSAVRHLVLPPAAERIGACAAWSELLPAIDSCRPSLLFIDPTVADFSLGGFDDVRARLPRVTMVALVEANARGARLAVDLVRRGSDSAFVTQGIPGEAAHLANLLDQAIAVRVTRPVLCEAEPFLPVPMRLLLEQLWVRCRRPVTQSEAARLYHRHPATLARHLRRAGLPSLRQVIAWGRLIHVSSLLEEPDRSTDNVAISLGYPSTTALYNQLHRYANLRPGDLRRAGQDLLTREFSRRLRDSDWCLYRL